MKEHGPLFMKCPASSPDEFLWVRLTMSHPNAIFVFGSNLAGRRLLCTDI